MANIKKEEALASFFMGTNQNNLFCNQAKIIRFYTYKIILLVLEYAPR